MELIDVLDEKGNTTGEKKFRKLVHRDGDWHRAVHVWVVNSKSQILMQRRSPNKENNPDKWDISIAGHVTSGFSSIETVVREAEEELGLNILPKDIKYLFTHNQKSVQNNGTYINNEVDDVYIVKLDLDILKLKLQEEEISEVKWVTLNDFEQITNNKTPGYVPHTEEYLKLIGYLKGR